MDNTIKILTEISRTLNKILGNEHSFQVHREHPPRYISPMDWSHLPT